MRHQSLSLPNMLSILWRWHNVANSPSTAFGMVCYPAPSRNVCLLARTQRERTPHLRRSERLLTGVDRQTKGDRSRLL